MKQGDEHLILPPKRNLLELIGVVSPIFPNNVDIRLLRSLSAFTLFVNVDLLKRMNCSSRAHARVVFEARMVASRDDRQSELRRLLRPEATG
jgi:hypothetical protein